MVLLVNRINIVAEKKEEGCLNLLLLLLTASLVVYCNQ